VRRETILILRMGGLGHCVPVTSSSNLKCKFLGPTSAILSENLNGQGLGCCIFANSIDGFNPTELDNHPQVLCKH
jgi:hypothetical protein